MIYLKNFTLMDEDTTYLGGWDRIVQQNAKIYNLDAEPVTIEKWYQLKNMRIYYDFFKLFQYNFEVGRKDESE